MQRTLRYNTTFRLRFRHQTLSPVRPSSSLSADPGDRWSAAGASRGGEQCALGARTPVGSFSGFMKADRAMPQRPVAAAAIPQRSAPPGPTAREHYFRAKQDSRSQAPSAFPPSVRGRHSASTSASSFGRSQLAHPRWFTIAADPERSSSTKIRASAAQPTLGALAARQTNPPDPRRSRGKESLPPFGKARHFSATLGSTENASRGSLARVPAHT